jgi:hypothetical protein
MFLSLLEPVEQNQFTTQLTPVLGLVYAVEALQSLEASPPMVEKPQSTQPQLAGLVEMEMLEVPELVAYGEMVALGQVPPVMHKTQVQVLHQTFQVLRWNMAVVEMVITIHQRVLHVPVLEVEMWLLLPIVVVEVLKHLQIPIVVAQVVPAL